MAILRERGSRRLPQTPLKQRVFSALPKAEKPSAAGVLAEGRELEANLLSFAFNVLGDAFRGEYGCALYSGNRFDSITRDRKPVR